MASAKLKNFFDNNIKSIITPSDRTAQLEPEIGLRIIHSPHDKVLRVTVLGAKHLPQNFGFTRVNGYVVKVKFLPGRVKFETTLKKESSPQWNEEFAFDLQKKTTTKFGRSKIVEEELSGSKFIVATLYAILGGNAVIVNEEKDDKKNKRSSECRSSSSKDKEKRKRKNGSDPAPQESRRDGILSQILGKSNRVGDRTHSENKIFEKRRTIGAATIPLNLESFSLKLTGAAHQSEASTGDLWKTLKPISSGIAGAEERRENKKGQIEISLRKERSSEACAPTDGYLTLTLLRFRCSVQTMHEHEALNSQMYIKMCVMKREKITHIWKSNRFPPCITMKFTPEQATVTVGNSQEGALREVRFIIRLIAKNKIGKKITVGHLTLGPEAGGSKSEHWEEALAKPGHQIIKWQNFE